MTDKWTPHDFGPIGPLRPTHLDTTGSSSDHELFATYSRMDQMKKVQSTMRACDMKIAVICSASSETPREDKARVTSIATELNRVLSESKVLVYEYTIVDTTWFSYLQQVPVTHYIFVNLPPVDQYNNKTPESEYFDPRTSSITKAVVVRSGNWNFMSVPAKVRRTAYTPVHYLEKFLQLEGSHVDVTGMALSHFSCELDL